LFDELFPRTAFHFDTSALSQTEWLEGLEGDELEHRWSVCLFADDLLRSAASYHGEGDIFVSYRFSSKFALLRGELAMATRRKTTQPIKDTDKAEWKGFLDFRLNDAQLAELDEWKPRPSDIWAEVDAAIAAGFRFTLSYNAKTHLASATMICDDTDKKYGGYALSSSDEDGALALKMAVFKHVKLAHDWTSLLDAAPTRGKRG